MCEADIPVTESLKDLINKRTVPFWKSVVEPKISGNLMNEMKFVKGTSFQLVK